MRMRNQTYSSKRIPSCQYKFQGFIGMLHLYLTTLVKGEISSIPNTFTVPQNPKIPATIKALVISFSLSSVGISASKFRRSPLVLVAPSGHRILDIRDVGSWRISVCRLPNRAIPPFRAPNDRIFPTSLASCEVTAACGNHKYNKILTIGMSRFTCLTFNF